VSGDNPFDNPLVKAAEKGLIEAIKCLLEAGANPNVPNTVRILFLSHSCFFIKVISPQFH
jgi:ankyrin repeat protein